MSVNETSAEFIESALPLSTHVVSAVDSPQQAEKNNAEKKARCTDPTKTDDYTFAPTIRIHPFRDIINGLSDAQKKRVVDVGFGGLLQLDFVSPIFSMNRWIIEHFDHETYAFKISDSRFFNFTPDDIHDIFCLPKNPNLQVSLFNHKRKSDAEEFCSMKKTFRDQLVVPPNKLARYSHVACRVKSIKDPSDEFVQWFIIAAYTMILFPDSSGKVKWDILKSLKDVNMITEYNWCALVHRGICRGVKSAKDHVSHRRSHEVQVKGCFFALQLAYFQHVLFQQSFPHSSLPLVDMWTKGAINNRIRAEKRCGEFGSGPISITTICSKLVCKNHLKDGFDKQSCPSSSQVHNDNISLLQDDLRGLLVEFRDDLKLFRDKHIPALVAKTSTLSQSCSMGTDTQFFCDPNVLREIDSLFRDIEQAKIQVANVSSQHMQNNRPPSPEAEKGDDEGDESDNGSDGSDHVIHIDEDREEPLGRDKEAEHDREGSQECHDSVGCPTNIIPHFVEASEDDVDGETDEAATSPEIRLCDDYVFFSKFCKDQSAHFIESFTNKELDVLDWAFYSKSDHSRNKYFDASSTMINDLARFRGSAFACKEDIMSLVKGSQIYNSIVDSYAYILNCEDDKSRFFFNTQAIRSWIKVFENVENKEDDKYNDGCEGMRNCWRKWMGDQYSANPNLQRFNYVFFPLCYLNHFVLFVFDFPQMRLHLLDNRRDSNYNSLQIFGEILKQQFSSFCSKNASLSSTIQSCTFNVYDFKWRSNAVGNDCGVFLVMHMQWFEGEFKGEN